MDNENRPEINYDIKLPDAELDVMMAIWSMDPPATSPKLMKRIGNQRGWKAPTLISFLLRLEERGFIESYKKRAVYFNIHNSFCSMIQQNYLASVFTSASVSPSASAFASSAAFLASSSCLTFSARGAKRA